jgi:hypothetical protein
MLDVNILSSRSNSNEIYYFSLNDAKFSASFSLNALLMRKFCICWTNFSYQRHALKSTILVYFHTLFFSPHCSEIVHISHYVNTVKVHLAKKWAKRFASLIISHCVLQIVYTICIHYFNKFSRMTTYMQILSISICRNIFTMKKKKIFFMCSLFSILASFIQFVIYIISIL